MLISCKKATEFIEKKDIFGLTKKEQFQLDLHVFLCAKCRKYQRLSEELDHTLRHFFMNKSDEELTLSEEKKEKIKDALKK
ncbi:hypothetical protein [Flammeovirga sp. EKP202]|uniref:hypothetical protein n=1 Tax=Flammeovirga sp. EKP202 TaxID=2770592 RepID=UPI00165F76A1|nr:hypothetical protein [Flammeovirga sp. EKP202]MBD0400858.1 hypothetical protein [Flammeovirga sp. EKP202]